MKKILGKFIGALESFLIRQWRALVLVGGLLVLMGLILMLPTIKELRSVEISPENPGLVLETGVAYEHTVLVPPGELAYFIMWIQEGDGVERVKKEDYEAVRLEVVSEGRVIREATEPVLIKRADTAALRWHFDPVVAEEQQWQTYVVKQMGEGQVKAQLSLADSLIEREIAATAFQLGEERNWWTLLVDKVYEEDFTSNDIAFYLYRGGQIVAGQNPYSCVLDEEESCLGFPAHFPGMYYVAAGAVLAGVENLADWEQVWRPIQMASWLGVGLVLFGYIYHRGQPVLAVAALGFWLFNRWSIEVLRIAHTDFVGVFLLLLAILLARRWVLPAALLLGASLAVKQVAVLVVPLFLIVVWRRQKTGVVGLLVILGLIILLPLGISVPFLIDDADAVIAGWLNVGARPAQVVHGFAPSLDTFLDVTHIGKSLMMILLWLVVYVAAWRKKVDLIGGTLMVMAIAMAFTSVLYNQYFVWFIPFIPLAVATMMKGEREYPGTEQRGED